MYLPTFPIRDLVHVGHDIASLHQLDLASGSWGQVLASRDKGINGGVSGTSAGLLASCCLLALSTFSLSGGFSSAGLSLASCCVLVLVLVLGILSLCSLLLIVLVASLCSVLVLVLGIFSLGALLSIVLLASLGVFLVSVLVASLCILASGGSISSLGLLIGVGISSLGTLGIASCRLISVIGSISSLGVLLVSILVASLRILVSGGGISSLGIFSIILGVVGLSLLSLALLLRGTGVCCCVSGCGSGCGSAWTMSASGSESKGISEFKNIPAAAAASSPLFLPLPCFSAAAASPGKLLVIAEKPGQTLATTRDFLGKIAHQQQQRFQLHFLFLWRQQPHLEVVSVLLL